MSNQRPSFAKRDREQKLRDKARMKAERRAARKAERVPGTSGPPSDPLPGEVPPATQDGLASAADGPAPPAETDDP